MPIRRSNVSMTVLAGLFCLAGGVAGAETIQGAMAKAYAHNPDLNAARALLRAIDENVTIAKAGYRPKVQGVVETSGQLNYLDRAPTSIFGTGRRYSESYSSSYGITVTQQIFDGFQTLNRVRAAEANVLAGRESLRAEEMSILLAAAQAYSNIARDQQTVSIRKQNLAFLREQLGAARARLDVGEGTRTDVSLAEAELAAANALLTAAVSQLRQSEAVYVQIVGDQPKGIKQASPARKAMPASLDQAVATGMREHPAVRAAERSVDAADYNVKAAEGALLPGVSVQGDVYRSRGSSDSQNNVTGGISARLTVPLYQGGAEYGQVRQAKEQLGQQELLVDSARLDVQRMIISAHTQYAAAEASSAANRAQIKAAQQALAGVVEERAAGQRTTLDVLNAQQNVLDARESLVNAERDAVVASYALLAATGRLTVHSQGLRVSEYRAEENFEAVKDKWFGLRTVSGR